jgi:hypothetical protein
VSKIPPVKAGAKNLDQGANFYNYSLKVVIEKVVIKKKLKFVYQPSAYRTPTEYNHRSYIRLLTLC